MPWAYATEPAKRGMQEAARRGSHGRAQADRICKDYNRSQGRFGVAARQAMKRHPSLVPLSRDHHHGLVMARRLILGRSTNPRAAWPADRSRQAARLIEFFETELRPHFEVEEAYVFPAAERHLGEDAGRMRVLIAEHETMRAMIRGLIADPASDLEERLIAFGELLEAHIHTEERILFERMQTACDADVLQALGARIAERGGGAGGPYCRV